MTCDFTSFSTVLQSYQDDGRIILQKLNAMEPRYGWELFALSGARTLDHQTSRLALKSLRGL